MNPPLDPNDSLTKLLVEESAGLAQAAAAEARARRRARANAARLAAPLAVLLIAALWLAPQFTRRTSPNRSTYVQTSKTAPPQGYVRIYHAGETPAIQQPSDEKEKQLLSALPDAPLLLVRNESGQLTRIHVFDSSQ